MAVINLGNIVATPNVLNNVPRNDINQALTRHVNGDWGEVCDEDRESNNYAVKNGERILSVYIGSNGVKFWVITEWDRSCTTVLLPEDY